jgi:LmbE family N-acetylglucosaminyl deacetylase
MVSDTTAYVPVTNTGPVLGVFAHPDDAEISGGGTLSKWAAAGREVHLLVLTNGDRGSGDPARDRAELARTRLAETEAAAVAMGLASARVLGIHDGELENTATVREAVIRRIREVRATTVLTVDPTAIFFQIPVAESNTVKTAYNHSDHRTAGAIALDAVFPGSGNPHFYPEHLGEGLDVQEVHDVWLGWTNEANHVEDVTDHFDTKIAALGRHTSQISEGIRMWDEWMRAEAKESGARAGVGLAEEFRVLDLS